MTATTTPRSQLARIEAAHRADLRWLCAELVKAWQRIEEQDALIASIRSFMAEKGDGGGG